MTDLPDLKIRALVNFPASAVGRTGIDVVKDGGTFYLDLNYADFQITPTVPAEDMPNAYNLIWDEVKQTFAKVPFSLQATAGVASLGGQTGALDIGDGLQFTGSTLQVDIGAGLTFVGGELQATGVLSLGGAGGEITLGAGLELTGSQLAADVASQAEAIDGSSNATVMTPLRTTQIMTRAMPRAFPPPYIPMGVRPVVVGNGAGPGRVTLNHSPSTYIQRDFRISAASSVVVVDDQDGNDANPGTHALPVKTLDFAGSQSTKQIVIVRAGIYVPPSISVLDPAFAGGRYVKQFFLMPGVRVASAGPRLQDQTFTVHSGTVYKATLTLTGAQTVQRVIRRDQFDLLAGEGVPLRKYPDVAALIAAGTQGWAIQTVSGNKEIYIRMSLGVDPNVNNARSVLQGFYVDTNAQSRWLVSGVPCLIHAQPGTVMFDGVSLVGTDEAGSASEVYADGIYARFAAGSGFQTFGSTNFFKNCIAHAPAADGFNYNRPTTGGNSQVVEHDCRTTNAGDIATFGTGISPIFNGSSVHDDVGILRAGSIYENCWGPQVADVSNAGGGTSWNIGVICGPTTEPQKIGFFSSDPGRKSYWDMCHAYGNTTALTSAGGPSFAAGCVLEGNVLGTLGSYDPETGL